MPPDPTPAPGVVPDAAVPPSVGSQRRRGLRPLWWIAGAAFAIGLVAMYYALPLIERWRTPPAPVAAQPVAAAPAAVAAVPAPPPLSIDALTARTVLLDAQLRAVEARMTSTDTASRAAASNASRAEALMIALAARRELNRGLPLGPLEAELHARFGAEQPVAVSAVIAAARSPVTLEDLRFALDGIAPMLITGTVEDGVWKAVGRELKGLIVLRRDTTPSPRPADRIIRVRRLLDSGQVEAALAEVARLPGAANATSWTTAARRYIEARRALNVLELAAMAPPPATAPPAAPTPAPSPSPTNTGPVTLEF